MNLRLSKWVSLIAVAWLCWSGLVYGGQNRTVYLLDIKGAIGPATSDYVATGLEKAHSAQSELIILRIDTPGGLSTSMREINKAILASSVPVVSFVAPSGARAASAGTYILYASHIAAMAPGTNLGAATPVQIGGETPFPLPGRDGAKKKKNGTDEKTEKTRKPKSGMNSKIVNDAVAYIRSLAQLRNRNAEWAEKAVREAASLPAQDALEQGVIDVVAKDIATLLKNINGREITVLGHPRKLNTADLVVETVVPNWRSRLLATITNPNVAYVLMLIGIYGLILEFYNPGTLVPGVIGAICLLLALYAFHVLPVNYVGVALILLGIALMIAEAFAPSFGILGLGGAVAFIIGSVMLLDTDIPGYQVSRVLIGSLAAVCAGLIVVTMTLLARSRGRPVVSGPEQMVGDTGKVVSWEGEAGTVRVHGELWNAKATVPLGQGNPVQVTELDGLTLVVKPLNKRR